MDSSPARRRAALAGALVAVLYVVGAAVSGSLSPLARRPLLDGVHSAAPYRWVQAPEGEASGPAPPDDVSQRIPLSATGNGETMVSTGESHVTLNLPAGAIKRADGRTVAEVKIEPLDHTQFTPLPGYLIRGNVYRVAIRSVPGGAGIPTVDPAGTLTLLYAAPSVDLVTARHDIMFSSEGQQWRVLAGQDQHATQQVSAPFVDIGYYAAVAQVPEDDPDAGSGGGFPWLVLVVVAVAGAAAFAVTTRLRRAREAVRRREEIRREDRKSVV